MHLCIMAWLPTRDVLASVVLFHCKRHSAVRVCSQRPASGSLHASCVAAATLSTIACSPH